jgi:hypothetical protein
MIYVAWNNAKNVRKQIRSAPCSRMATRLGDC